MNGRWRWRDAQQALDDLTRAGLRVMEDLAWLPLAPEPVLQQLSGVQDDAHLYRTLGRLQAAGLVDAIRPPYQPGRSYRLWYLTDLGLAVVALRQGVDPADIARSNHVRGQDLRSLLPGLPYQLQVYDLLAAVAGAFGGRRHLAAWQCPWRGRFQPLAAKSPVTVSLPAFASLTCRVPCAECRVESAEIREAHVGDMCRDGWAEHICGRQEVAERGGATDQYMTTCGNDPSPSDTQRCVASPRDAAHGTRHFFLLPDPSTIPIQTYKSRFAQLLALRRLRHDALPLLVIATCEEPRVSAWQQMLAETGRARNDLPLAAIVATWDRVGEEVQAAAGIGWNISGDTELVPCTGTVPVRVVQAGRRIPLIVGEPFASTVPYQGGKAITRKKAAGERVVATEETGAGRVSPSSGSLVAAFHLSATDRLLLDVMGRHPFLSVDDLAAIFGWSRTAGLRRWNALKAAGLVRLLEAREGGERAAEQLAELTLEGLEIAAAQQGLSLATAIRWTGLAGGGPDSPVGQRVLLARHLKHTLGVNEVFAGLYRSVHRMREMGRDDAVLEWRSSAACARGAMRPDGYGLIRHAGRQVGFFLEYDRGTMSARDIRAKFTAYYDYRNSGRFERDYLGFPTILLVTTNRTAEERIERAVQAVGSGRGPPLPVLITCDWRIARDPSNPQGLLGSIWRDPHGGSVLRRPWPLDGPVGHQAGDGRRSESYIHRNV